ncbi:MAG: exodeoxyribonuclease V subunit alpha [Actinomycetales bacterium]|nr:exodeoxyribonuclease V subunit alpha [Actinomycetales bacterium]
MTARDLTVVDRELAEVVLRRFGPPTRSALLARIVTSLARAVREDHAAMDLTRDDDSFGDARLALDALRAAPTLCAFIGRDDELGASGAPLVVFHDRYLYLRRWARAEWRVARAIDEARAAELELPSGLTTQGVDAAIAAATEELGRNGFVAAELGEVVTRLLTRRVSFVTGGPGTGKTWLVTQALRVLERALGASGAPAMTVAVAAPTAKAARRLGEVLDAAGVGASPAVLARDRDREGSLHHLLNLHPNAVARPRPLWHDVVVVDEASMADLAMLDLLLRSAAGSLAPCRVVLVGDPYQLASVNVGAVLADAVDPEARTEALVTRLATVHRTENRDILDFAALVKAGDGEAVRDFVAAGHADVRHVGRFEDPALLERVFEHARALRDAARGGDRRGAAALASTLTVLAANREGPGSVAWWNERVRAALAEGGVPSGRFCVGEPVLVTRNQRTIGLFNGDVGVVVEAGGELVVSFDDGRERPLAAIAHVEPAWAMTIHKSQGSEYDHVVVVLPRAGSPLLSRELLYTGITRAKRSVALVGDLASVAAATERRVDRVSGLTERLR